MTRHLAVLGQAGSCVPPGPVQRQQQQQQRHTTYDEDITYDGGFAVVGRDCVYHRSSKGINAGGYSTFSVMKACLFRVYGDSKCKAGV
jgi:hypothetical protein